MSARLQELLRLLAVVVERGAEDVRVSVEDSGEGLEPGAERRKDGSIAANPQRMGPLTGGMKGIPGLF